MNDLTIYLLRHGESAANRERIFSSRRMNSQLTDEGIRQAVMQAESLKNTEFSAIYASPMFRARQTAEIVNKYHGHEIQISHALREIDEGLLDGESQNDPEKWKIYKDMTKNWSEGSADAAYPDGESLNDVEKRLRSFFDGLKGEDQKPILVVGHCLLFMAVFWLFCDRRGPRFEDGYMGRGHLSVISGNSGGFRVIKFNVPPDATA